MHCNYCSNSWDTFVYSPPFSMTCSCLVVYLICSNEDKLWFAFKTKKFPLLMGFGILVWHGSRHWGLLFTVAPACQLNQCSLYLKFELLLGESRPQIMESQQNRRNILLPVFSRQNKMWLWLVSINLRHYKWMEWLKMKFSVVLFTHDGCIGRNRLICMDALSSWFNKS